MAYRLLLEVAPTIRVGATDPDGGPNFWAYVYVPGLIVADGTDVLTVRAKAYDDQNDQPVPGVTVSFECFDWEDTGPNQDDPIGLFNPANGQAVTGETGYASVTLTYQGDSRVAALRAHYAINGQTIHNHDPYPPKASPYWMKALFAEYITHGNFIVYFTKNGPDKIPVPGGGFPTYADDPEYGGPYPPDGYARDIVRSLQEAYDTYCNANGNFANFMIDHAHPEEGGQMVNHTLVFTDTRLDPPRFAAIVQDMGDTGFTNGFYSGPAEGYNDQANKRYRTRHKSTVSIRNDLWKEDLRLPPDERPTERENGYLAFTCAHELFHAVQNRYEASQNEWLREGSANWATDYVFPGANWYIQTIPWVLNNPYPNMVPFDPQGKPDRRYFYGMSVFLKYLVEVLALERQDPQPLELALQIYDTCWLPEGASLTTDQYTIDYVEQAIRDRYNDPNFKIIEIMQKFWDCCEEKPATGGFTRDNDLLLKLNRVGD